MTPANYDEWKHCIVEVCGIPLTPQYVQKRIQILSDTEEFETQRFISLYGSQHHGNVISWFRTLEEVLGSFKYKTLSP